MIRSTRFPARFEDAYLTQDLRCLGQAMSALLIRFDSLTHDPRGAPLMQSLAEVRDSALRAVEEHDQAVLAAKCRSAGQGPPGRVGDRR
jgi:hypothetical protein